MNFFQNVKLKVSNAVEILMNSPIIRKRIPTDAFGDLSEKGKEENYTIQENYEDDNKSTEDTDINSDFEISEEKESSDTDSVFDSTSNFHNYYYPGISNQNQIRSIIENKLTNKLTKQISDPGTDNDDSWKRETSPNSNNSRNDYSKFYYVSPRRDSLFDTIQLKSSMNHHLKYGDHKERLTFSVSTNSTNDAHLFHKEYPQNIKELVYSDIKENDLSKLGAIGFQVVDEDGEENMLEIDITDIEAANEEQNLTKARRLSISDRINKRRNSDIMAEIIRLSAENRKKEFKNLLIEHRKLVQSIDSGFLYKKPSENSKIELSTLDSYEGSTDDLTTDSSNGIWDQNDKTISHNENENNFSYINSNEDESVLPK